VVNDPVLALGLLAFGLLLLVLPLSFWALSGDRNSPWVRLLVAAANLCLTAQLVLRWWESGHFPISNLYESLCFLAWGCTLVQLLVERKHCAEPTWETFVLAHEPTWWCSMRKATFTWLTGQVCNKLARLSVAERQLSAPFSE